MCSLSNGVKKTGLGPTYAENFDDGDIDDGDPTDWYTTGSYWDASSGELKWTSTAGISGQCSNPDLTYSDFQAEFDLMADGYYQDNYWAAFAFRKNSYSDWYSTSGYMVYYRYNGWIELYSASGGVLKTSNTGKDLSTWRHVKIVASGSSIKVYVDGNLEIDHSDGTYTNGYFGLNVFGVSARYDNLAVLSNTEVHYLRDVDVPTFRDGGVRYCGHSRRRIYLCQRPAYAIGFTLCAKRIDLQRAFFVLLVPEVGVILQ